MPTSSYVAYALELLAPLGPVRARAMMGGHIVHCGGAAVALLYDDRLYLKTDEETREAFRAAGGELFTYELRGKVVEMSFCTPPDSALDSPDSMQPWAELALAAALRKRRATKGTRRSLRRSPRPSASPPPRPRKRLPKSRR
jgi:DNA transformation protein and related proteins